MTLLIDPHNLSPLLFRSRDSTDEPVSGYVSDKIAVEAVANGRGLVAAASIAAGECLFVENPVVSADIESVVEQWTPGCLEELSETSLLLNMRQGFAARSAKAWSLLALEGCQDVREVPTIDRLLAKEEPGAIESITEHELLQIIRRNAFGPDFVTYSSLERRWQSNPSFRPYHLLGMYPLAAMLNHSCVGNALRVFSGKTMVVHASRAIAPGEEIVWSYILPGQPYTARRVFLVTHHGFECGCERCLAESALGNVLNEDKSAVVAEFNVASSEQMDREGLQTAIDVLEDEVFQNRSISNTDQRYLRLSYINVYLAHLNMELTKGEKRLEDLLSMAMQLHFAFCTSHNASTEHLSVS